MEYYYIYKITCLAGSFKDHYYIGQRKCHCLPEEDPYKGSGTKILDYYKKYPHDYKKEIICLCKDADDLNQKEDFYVGDLYKTDPMCLNLVAGGNGYHIFDGEKNGMYGKKHSEYSKKLMSINNGSHRQEVRDKISKSRIKFCKEHPGYMSGDKNGMYGKTGGKNPASKQIKIDNTVFECVKYAAEFLNVKCNALYNFILRHNSGVDYKGHKIYW